ncbi:MAG TPA: transposase [Nitrososphaeraceae archaeon]
MLYQDEKGPIAVKTYGGPSWCSTQTKKVEKAQKVKGILNTFGIYDHTNDQIYIYIYHCYRNKTSNQFIDFIKRVDFRYDSSIKTIFVVLDNASIHRSKKTRNAIVRSYPRIFLVSQPTRSPELNLIEVRWMWLQRNAINNSTFRNESDIEKAVSDWTSNYNNSHSNR